MTDAPKRRPGRPPAAGVPADARIEARVTPERAATYRRLGGVRWLNAQLDRESLNRAADALK